MASKAIAPEILLICISLFQAVLCATSSVVVVGSVFCDTCLEHKFSKTSSYFIPGALVAAECSINRKTTSSISIKGNTDENGEFSLEIPSILSHSLNRCSVHMLSSPDSACNIPSMTTFAALNSKLNINLKGGGTYNAGSFSYRPLNVPAMCYKSSPFNYLRLRGRAALEGGSPTPPPLIPNLPRFNFPPLPISFPFPPPINPGGSSFPLPQIPPFPFTFPSPPPAQEDDVLKSNAPPPSSPPFPGIPPLPKLTFPPIPSIPLARPPPFPFQFPPIPFLNPPSPPTQHKTP